MAGRADKIIAWQVKVKMNIGKAIREVRKKKGISQIELANAAEITQTALSQIESGLKRANPTTMKNICIALSIPEPMLNILGTEESDIPEETKEIYKSLFPAIEGLVLQLVPKK